MNKFSSRSKMPDEKLPLLLSSTDTNNENESFKCFSANAEDRHSDSSESVFNEHTGNEADQLGLGASDDDLNVKLISATSRDSTRPISNCETMIHLLKGNMGTGLFAIPDAFKNAGLLVGSIGLPIMAIICIHCMHILIRCSNIMKKRRGIKYMDYADVVETACVTGPENLARYGVFARKVINLFVCITQFGFCCVYIVFAATNFEQVISHYLPNLDFDIRVYMAILTVPIILLCWIRKLKYLSPVSLLANMLQTASLVLLFYFLFQDLPSVSSRPAFGSWSKLPLYFGTAVFAFEGVSLVLPLQKDMRTPSSFEGLTGVLNTGMVIVSCFYFAVGFYGYLKYGAAIEGSITLNLPPEDRLAQLVKLMMVLAILGSYAVQFYVPMEIMWPSISRNFETSRQKLMAEYAFRTLLVLVTFGLAAAIPKLDLFISLVGAFSSSFLALIFPPLLELITFWPNPSKWTMFKDISIIVFGIIGFFAGTYASIESLVTAFSS